MIKPAGCNGSIFPVPRKYLSPINAPIGKKASTPGGLVTKTVAPPVSQYRTNK